MCLDVRPSSELIDEDQNSLGTIKNYLADSDGGLQIGQGDLEFPHTTPSSLQAF